MVRQFMKSERGVVTDDAVGDEFGGNSECVMPIQERVRELVKAATELIERALLLPSGKGLRP